MKISKAIIPVAIGAATTAAVIGFGDFNAETTSGDLQPGDKVFTKPVDNSGSGELTIISFNVRDVKGTNRTLEDFQALADLVDEADIVVFQELGAKGYRSRGSNDEMYERFDAMAAVYKSYLGDEWEFVMAKSPTPQKLSAGTELPCIAYKKEVNGMNIRASWNDYFDLGERRDMGMFNVTCEKGNRTENFTIGSVHTKPSCPERGDELLKIAEYVETNQNEKFIIMGDFNWGYYSTCSNGYKGEDKLKALHESGKVYQVFHDISFTGKGKADDFRTNLNLRSTPQMYDQFLVCKAYANKLSEGGKLGSDCGFFDFSEQKYFQDAVSDEVRGQIKGVKAYMKKNGESYTTDEGKATLKEMEEYIRKRSTTIDAATHHMSDHKPIWMQLKLF